jgi:hypothetical protein
MTLEEMELALARSDAMISTLKRWMMRERVAETLARSHP